MGIGDTLDLDISTIRANVKEGQLVIIGYSMEHSEYDT